MFEALEQAAIRKSSQWTTDREDSFASILEMLHMQYLAFAKANGAKKWVNLCACRARPISRRLYEPRDFAMKLMS